MPTRDKILCKVNRNLINNCTHNSQYGKVETMKSEFYDGDIVTPDTPVSAIEARRARIAERKQALMLRRGAMPSRIGSTTTLTTVGSVPVSSNLAAAMKAQYEKERTQIDPNSGFPQDMRVALGNLANVLKRTERSSSYRYKAATDAINVLEQIRTSLISSASVELGISK